MSAASGSSSNSESQLDMLNIWPYERLKEHVNSTIQSNKVLKAETDMFITYFNKLDLSKLQQPSDIHSKRSPTPTFSHSRTSPSTDHFRSASRGTSSHTRTAGPPHHFERLLKLKAIDKCDIAQKEFERVKALQRKHIDESERTMDHLKAVIEETMESELDIRKDEYEFDRDVVKHFQDTNHAISEKLTRYFDEKMKYKEACISKFRLKCQALRQENKRVGVLLRNKEEIGDILTEIDFQQLKIENADCLERIDERNRDFFRIKTNGTIVSHTFTFHKRKLDKTLRECSQLKQEIASRNALIVRLDAETKYCELERAKAQAINRKHRAQLTVYKVPEVMDAVHLKSDLVWLTKNVTVWERKNQIAEMALAAQKKKWAKLKEEAIASPIDIFIDNVEK